MTTNQLFHTLNTINANREKILAQCSTGYHPDIPEHVIIDEHVNLMIERMLDNINHGYTSEYKAGPDDA